jgi:DNA-directed RNA polymerase subunit alpha
MAKGRARARALSAAQDVRQSTQKQPEYAVHSQPRVTVLTHQKKSALLAPSRALRARRASTQARNFSRDRLRSRTAIQIESLYCLPQRHAELLREKHLLTQRATNRHDFQGGKAMTRIPLSSWDEKQKLMGERLEMSTAEIGLSVRTTNCLEERGIFTVNDLLHCTREDLLSISNFGEKTLEEVYKALENVGFFRPKKQVALRV